MHRSGAPRRTNENAKLIITTIVGVVFGFFVGITLPLGSFRKISLPSGLMSSLDVAMSDGKLFSGGRSPEDIGSRKSPKIYVPTNPHGAELLPPGIIVAETDFYLRRLWGEPSEDLKKKPKYLVTFTVGFEQRNNINAAVKKFSEDFQILLFHYDGRTTEWDQFEWSKNAIHISAKKQTKWWYAKRFLHPDVVSAYEYIFIWDEDLGVEHFNADRYVVLFLISWKPRSMDRVVFFFLIAATLLAGSLGSTVISGEVTDGFVNPIRQVVPEENDEQLLNAEHHFTLFKSKYEKTYATQVEHDHRFRVFKANLRRARRNQLLDPSAVHGVTQFSDLTPKEFRRKFLGLKRRGFRLPTDTQTAPILPTSDLPTEFDWREQGAVTPVKNQGMCGSCWSFSAIGALEGAHFLATKELVSLSEQQLVDCDHECDPAQANSCDSGCSGGLMNNAFEYALKAGGLMKEEDYPYTGRDHTACKFDKSKIVASVSNFSVVSSDEDQIAANLVQHGPLAIAINAMWMQTYIGGVSCPYVCSKSQDHGVLLVGFGSSGYAPIRLKEKPYWIIKNSWGAMWGEHGYYKICRGPHNMCGMDTMVSTVAAVHTSPK